MSEFTMAGRVDEEELGLIVGVIVSGAVAVSEGTGGRG